MKTTKKQLEEIKEIEKKVAEVCGDKIAQIALDNKGAIVDKKTGKVYPNNSTDETTDKKNHQEISITLSFGENSTSIKSQLKEQGFNVKNHSDRFFSRIEAIKRDLHWLNEEGVLNNKQLLKCFEKLNKAICKEVLNKEIPKGMIAVHVSTIHDK